MKKLLTLLSMTIIAVLLFTNCTKDDEPIMPTLTLKSETGYVSSNTTVPYGDTLLFGVIANGNGTDNLVKFKVEVNDTLLFGVIANGNGTDNLVKFKVEVNDQLLLDSTINTQNFNFDFYTIKGITDVESWVLTVTDIEGNSTNKTITITGEFGEIDSYTTILMGAQDNVTDKSFLSLSNNAATTYYQAEAFEHQADIDMFCFFENTPESQNMMSLAAPGTGITGIFSGATAPENYTVKNTTYFVKTTLTAAQFEGVDNDAVILDSYDPDNKFRKAKKLTVGDVYSFKLQSGKFGLFKVIAVDGEETGTLEIAIKVQK